MVPATICFINQKGGCGKSSSCFHLAGAFARFGLEVLLVDMDPQGSLSQAVFGPSQVEQLPADLTLAAIFDEHCPAADFSQLVRHTSLGQISICPANHHLGAFNTPAPETLGMEQFLLREYIDQAGAFDMVLIDCPPNLYRCSWSAMLASDWVVVPVPPEDFGTQGLRAVHQAIREARQLNPVLRTLGHLVTRHDRRLVVHRAYEQRLRQLYADMVLETVIPEASAFKVALTCRQPVELSSPRSAAANLTRTLAREILDRIALKHGSRQVA